MDWLDLLAVQGTLKHLLHYHSSKASILQCSAFFMVQLSHPYMNTGKTIALTRWTFVENIMSLLFNMLSRLVVTFLPRSKHLLVSWMQSPSAVILELKKKNKVWHCLHCFPIYLPWSDGTRRHDLSFLFFYFILFLNFTIFYWFCQISKWIRHRYTCVPHPEPSSLLPPHTIPLGRPSAPAPSIQYRASNLDWRLVPYMLVF